MYGKLTGSLAHLLLLIHPSRLRQISFRNITVFENFFSFDVRDVRMMKRIFSEMLFLAIFSQINQEGIPMQHIIYSTLPMVYDWISI